MSLKLLTPPTVPAVTLAEAKEHAKVDVSADDAFITTLIAAATEFCEDDIGRCIMPQTWEMTLDSFPPAFELLRIPVASVTAITYTNTAGNVVTLGAGYYQLDAKDDFSSAYVVPAYGTEWPDTREQVNAVSLTFVAGYPNAAAVPEAIKLWIKEQVTGMYENRGSQNEKQLYVSPLLDRLVRRYKVYRL